MDENIAYQILNKHQNQYYSEDGQFVVEYTYFPIGRRGKEFLDAFNLIFVSMERQSLLMISNIK